MERARQEHNRALDQGRNVMPVIIFGDTHRQALCDHADCEASGSFGFGSPSDGVWDRQHFCNGHAIAREREAVLTDRTRPQDALFRKNRRLAPEVNPQASFAGSDQASRQPSLPQTGRLF